MQRNKIAILFLIVIMSAMLATDRGTLLAGRVARWNDRGLLQHDDAPGRGPRRVEWGRG